jgi:hypothetical protein
MNRSLSSRKESGLRDQITCPINFTFRTKAYYHSSFFAPLTLPFPGPPLRLSPSGFVRGLQDNNDEET